MPQNDDSRPGGRLSIWSGWPVSALTGLETALRLVDDIDAALTAHDAAIAMALLERAERIANLHWSFLCVAARRLRLGCVAGQEPRSNSGGRYWDRTSGHYDVNVVLYR